MTEKLSKHTTKETLMYLRQCLLPGDGQNGIDLEVPSWLVREATDALASLEQRVEGMPEFVPLPDGRPTNTFEAYIAWKLKAEKAEQRVERFRVLLDEFQQEAQTRYKDYAPEMINTRIIALKEALASQEEAKDPSISTAHLSAERMDADTVTVYPEDYEEEA